MKVEIVNINLIYDFLENPPIRGDSESWKGEDSAVETAKKVAGFSIHSLTLPTPLHRLGGIIRRHGEFYSAIMWAEPQKGYDFKGVSKRIEEIVAAGNSSKPMWVSTSDYGTGYFFRENNPMPTSTILTSGRELTDDRVICMGIGGAYLRKFHKENLAIDLGELSSKVSLLIEACLDESTRKRFESKVLQLSG